MNEWMALVDTIGEPVAEVLMRVYPGCELYVPMIPTNRLCNAITAEAAHILCQAAGGERIIVPRNHASAIAERNRRIAEASARGKSANELAIAHKTTSRTVRRARKKHAEQSKSEQSHTEQPRGTLL